MAVVRAPKDRDFTVISNYCFKDKRLSLKAKGLLSIMLSLPESWSYSVNGLVTLSKDGKASVFSAIGELEKYGYLVRYKLIDKETHHFVGNEYDIYEIPPAELQAQSFPSTEIPPQLNI